MTGTETTYEARMWWESRLEDWAGTCVGGAPGALALRWHATSATRPHAAAKRVSAHASDCHSSSFVRRIRLLQPGVLQRLRSRRPRVRVERQKRLNERAEARICAAQTAAQRSALGA